MPAKHRKGKMPVYGEVACQIIWNSIPPYINDKSMKTEYNSPFFFFRNETAMRKWQKEARKLFPSIKFRRHNANWTPETAMTNLEGRIVGRAPKHR